MFRLYDEALPKINSKKKCQPFSHGFGNLVSVSIVSNVLNVTNRFFEVGFLAITPIIHSNQLFTRLEFGICYQVKYFYESLKSF